MAGGLNIFYFRSREFVMMGALCLTNYVSTVRIVRIVTPLIPYVYLLEGTVHTRTYVRTQVRVIE